MDERRSHAHPFRSTNVVRIWYFGALTQSQARTAASGKRVLIRDAAMARASIQERHLVRARVSRMADGGVRLDLEPLSAPALSSVLGRGPMPPRAAVTMVAHLAKAVDALERRHLAARDLAPDSVLLDNARGAVLVDYGIPPQLLPLSRPDPDPNFAFRAPEETSHAISPRASVYSLGALLLAALTGDPEPERIRARDPGDSRDLPQTLGSVIARAMAVDPGRRHGDVMEMARAAVEVLQTSDRLERARAAQDRERSETAVRESARPRKSAPRDSRRSKGAARRSASAGPTLRAPAPKRRGARHADAARTPARNRKRAGGLSVGTIRRHLGRRGVAFSILAACGLAVGAIGIASLGETSSAAATTISSPELTLRLPSGWERAKVQPEGFGRLSSPLAARQSNGTLLLAAVMLEPTETVRAIRRLAPMETAPVAARLGKLEVRRYDGITTGRGGTASAYVLNTTGQSVLVVCQGAVDATRSSLSGCADTAAGLRLRDEQPISLAAADARGPAAYRALTSLRGEFLADRARIANAPVAADQADAVRDLEVTYYEASREIQATGLPGQTIATLVRELYDTGEAYGALAAAIDDGSSTAYDEARAEVVLHENRVWTTAPDGAVASITNQR
jgi:hypothetical protein